MKTLKTITSAKDVLSLIDHFCSKHPERAYKLCQANEVRLIQASPSEAPKWIAPITFLNPDGNEQGQIKYFIYDHEFCTLHIQNDDPNNVIACPLKENKYDTYLSPFHHWIVKTNYSKKNVVETIFNIPKTLDPVPLPEYMGEQCFYEYTPRCPVLFLTASDVIDAFPFRELVNHVKKIELKVTKNGGPLWLLTQNSGKKYVVYPFALHRFYDELDASHDFDELNDPQKDQEFLVYHFVSDIVCSLIALKTIDGKNLIVSRFSKMKL